MAFENNLITRTVIEQICNRDSAHYQTDEYISNTLNMTINLFFSLIRPISTVYEAHLSCGRRRLRRRKVCFWIIFFDLLFNIYYPTYLQFIQAESMSITSVLYLKDEVSIATAGAVDRFLRNFVMLESIDEKIIWFIPILRY